MLLAGIPEPKLSLIWPCRKGQFCVRGSPSCCETCTTGLESLQADEVIQTRSRYEDRGDEMGNVARVKVPGSAAGQAALISLGCYRCRAETFEHIDLCSGETPDCLCTPRHEKHPQRRRSSERAAGT